MSQSNIVVRGAREHNLKGFDVTLPRDSLIVIFDCDMRAYVPNLFLNGKP